MFFFFYLVASVFCHFSSFLELLIGLGMYVVFGYVCDLCYLLSVNGTQGRLHSALSQMSRRCVCHSTTSGFMRGWAMPSLSNSKTDSTAQIYGSECGSILCVAKILSTYKNWSLDASSPNLTPQSGTRTWDTWPECPTLYHCAMLAVVQCEVQASLHSRNKDIIN